MCCRPTFHSATGSLKRKLHASLIYGSRISVGQLTGKDLGYGDWKDSVRGSFYLTHPSDKCDNLRVNSSAIRDEDEIILMVGSSPFSRKDGYIIDAIAAEYWLSQAN